MELNVVKKRHRTRSKGVRGRCGVHAWAADVGGVSEEGLAGRVLQL